MFMSVVFYDVHEPFNDHRYSAMRILTKPASPKIKYLSVYSPPFNHPLLKYSNESLPILCILTRITADLAGHKLSFFLRELCKCTLAVNCSTVLMKEHGTFR